MKKFNFLVAAVLLLFAGCQKEEGVATVRLHVNNFEIFQEELPTRGQPVSGYNGVKFLTLAFYNSSGTEVYKSVQARENPTTYTTFGDFECSLPMGSYTMVVLGYALYDDDVLTLTSPTQAEFTAGCVRETFAATQVVNINSTNDVNLSAALDRVVTKLQVVSTDGKTANASKVRMTFSAGGKAFNPTTGLATVNTGAVSTVNNSASVGASSSSIGYLFLASDEQTMTVTIDVLDADGESISHKVVNNVPFKRNRCTKLSGSLYTTSAESDFTVNTEWLTEYSMTF